MTNRGRRNVIELDGDALEALRKRGTDVLAVAVVLLGLAAFWGLVIYAVHAALT